MNRREFMQTSIAGLALSAAGRYSAEAADSPPKRVGLIGCGWYGKSDIFRLVQVAPVEIVSLCDVDKKMMAGCAEMAAARQASLLEAISALAFLIIAKKRSSASLCPFAKPSSKT